MGPFQRTDERNKQILREVLEAAAKPDPARDAVTRQIGKSPLARVDYVGVVDRDSLKELRTIERPAIIAVAVFFGTTRLIDNILLKND